MRFFPRILSALLFSLGGLCLPGPAVAWNGFELADMGFSEARQATIHARDATRLAARLIVPSVQRKGQTFPVIVMVDQWAARPGDFLVQAVRYASDGFVVLVYQPRGYGHSAGDVDLGGTRDLQDFGAVLDWLILHAPVDESRIGVLGASAGGVIALIAAAQDPLVKAVAALGAWTGLADSVHYNGVGRVGWNQFVEAGSLPQRLVPATRKHILDLQAGKRGKELLRWAEDRSATTWLHLLNRRMVPVLLTANYDDELGNINEVVGFYESLQGPRRLLMTQGGHAAAESNGSLRVDSYVWDQALDWMNRWLRPEAKALKPVAALSMELSDSSVRDEFSEWPGGEIAMGEFYLSPRGATGSGGLDLRPWEGKQPTANVLRSPPTGALSEAEQTLQGVSSGVAWLPSLDSRRTLIFESAALSRLLPIRGIPRLDLQFKPSTDAVQITAALYDVNNLGLGRVISRTAIHLTDLQPNVEMTKQLEFRVLAHDVEPGNHLALVLDTQDTQFVMPELSGFAVQVLFSDQHQPLLRVPYHQVHSGADPQRLAELHRGVQ